MCCFNDVRMSNVWFTCRLKVLCQMCDTYFVLLYFVGPWWSGPGDGWWCWGTECSGSEFIWTLPGCRMGSLQASSFDVLLVFYHRHENILHHTPSTSDLCGIPVHDYRLDAEMSYRHGRHHPCQSCLDIAASLVTLSYDLGSPTAFWNTSISGGTAVQPWKSLAFFQNVWISFRIFPI